MKSMSCSAARLPAGSDRAAGRARARLRLRPAAAGASGGEADWRPLSQIIMPITCDPAALRRHALAVGDRRLAELVGGTLAPDADLAPPWSQGQAAARCAYAILCIRLGLLADRELPERI
jgi:hypothetical protein